MPQGSAYNSAQQYAEARPQYEFAGLNVDDLLVRRTIALSDGGEATLIDCGAGPGLIWDRLDGVFPEIVGVEPNTAMWNASPPPSARYVRASALTYLANTNPSNAIVAWFWSISYAVLSFFEVYDDLGGRFIRFDETAAAAAATHALSKAVARWASCPQIYFVFDERSAEQSFVTNIWSRAAPFPFRDRSYPRRLLCHVLQRVADRNNARLHEERLTGIASYGRVSAAAQRMHAFQFHGHFVGVGEVRRAVDDFVNRYASSAAVEVPAGCYIYQYMPRRSSFLVTGPS